MDNKENIIIPAFFGNITELLNENKEGKDKQWHSKNFKKLLRPITKKIEVLEIKVQKYILEKRQSYLDLIMIINQDKLVYKNEKVALVVLSKIMNTKYNDGDPNVVFYLNEISELCSAGCYWSRDKEWHCDSDSDCMDGYRWATSSRIFYPKPS